MHIRWRQGDSFDISCGKLIRKVIYILLNTYFNIGSKQLQENVSENNDMFVKVRVDSSINILTIERRWWWQSDHRDIVCQEEGVPVLMDKEISANHWYLWRFIDTDVMGTHDHFYKASAETSRCWNCHQFWDSGWWKLKSAMATFCCPILHLMRRQFFFLW